MQRPSGTCWVVLIAVVLLASACSGDSATQAPGALDAQPAAEETAAPRTMEEFCQQGASAIVNRLDEFLAGFEGQSPEEFLGQDEIEGLAGFQNEVAEIIGETARPDATLCNLDGLQERVDRALVTTSDRGLLAEYVVSSIRFGGVREVRDVEIGPDDDLAAILALLDDGSTVTFPAGQIELDAPLLIDHDVTFIGAGMDETAITSSAPEAAVAVFNGGVARMRDLTISHDGTVAASVVLAFGAPVDLDRVRLSGATAQEDAPGGNGLLLSAAVADDDAVDGEDGEEGTASAAVPGAEALQSRVVNSEVLGNEIAGIAVSEGVAPHIEQTTISDNELCGLCFLGTAAGLAVGNTVERNEFGIQAGDDAAPMVIDNVVRDNEVAGVVVLGRATATLRGNQLTSNGDVGIAIQESASPLVSDNRVDDHQFGITVVGASTATVRGNTVQGSETGIQIAEQANPTVDANQFLGVRAIGVLVRDQATGSVTNTIVRGTPTVGALIEGTAAPAISAITIDGAEVGISYREQAAGTLATSEFDRPAIAVQIEDQAAPGIGDLTITAPSAAGIVIRSTGATTVRGLSISDPESLGIGVAGDGNVAIDDIEVTGGQTAVSFVESSRGSVSNSRFSDQIVSLQIGDSSAVDIDQNRVTGAEGAGIVFRDSATGSATSNTIVGPRSIGIQITTSETLQVVENTVLSGVGISPPEPAFTDPEEASGEELRVGLLLAGEGASVVRQNEILGFDVGIQLSDSVAPTIDQNLVDSGTSGGVGFLYRDAAAGTAEANRTTGHSIGFQISDSATPTLVRNTVEQVVDVAFLIQGSAAPLLTENVCPDGAPGIGRLDASSPTLTANECGLVDA